MFRVEGWVGKLLDGFFRIGYLLDFVGRAPARTKHRHGSTCSTPDRRQKESFRSEQLHHGRLKEAFAPGAAKSEALVKRLPAKPNLGHRRVGVVVQPLVVPDTGREFQRVKAGYVPLRAENRNERFRINSPRFAPGRNVGYIVLEAGLVIHCDVVAFTIKRAAK